MRLIYDQWEVLDTCPICNRGKVHYRYEVAPQEQELAEWAECDRLECHTIFDVIYPQYSHTLTNRMIVLYKEK
ncbi:hypothetical protein BPGQ101_19725 [Bacillus altitudinis]|uniref:hypothetical protein n=1 Tax=Bacillus altitudinis TaxID=293387 RepID=UPI0010FF9FD0|nr:hypothetical protein [Bacillus altitudinis]QCU21009.1 hypothetical protein BPGQ101_19725 [Bacillus altitudinis]